MEIVGEIIRKTGEPGALAIEAAKASMAFDIGKDCGLFYAPKVVNFDAKTGVLEFERLNSLVTLLDMAARRDERVFELMIGEHWSSYPERKPSKQKNRLLFKLYYLPFTIKWKLRNIRRI